MYKTILILLAYPILGFGFTKNLNDQSGREAHEPSSYQRIRGTWVVTQMRCPNETQPVHSKYDMYQSFTEDGIVTMTVRENRIPIYEVAQPYSLESDVLQVYAGRVVDKAVTNSVATPPRSSYKFHFEEVEGDEALVIDSPHGYQCSGGRIFVIYHRYRGG